MVARGLRHLSPEDRELLERHIAAGEFRDESEFEEFAIRRAIAELHMSELRELRRVRPPRRVSTAEIIKESRKIRKAVARRHGL